MLVNFNWSKSIPDPDFLADWAHELTMYIRAWVGGEFLAAVSPRPETERKAIVDDLFQRMEIQFKNEHRIDSVDAYIMMRKISA